MPLPLTARPSHGGALRICLVVAAPDDAARGELDEAYERWAGSWAALGHDVTIGYCAGPSGPAAWGPEAPDGVTRGAIAPPAAPHYECSAPVLQAIAVHHWLVERQPDVVHIADRGGAGFFAQLAKRQGSAFQHTTFVIGVKGPALWHSLANQRLVSASSMLEAAHMERRSHELADRLVSPGRAALDWAAAQGWRSPTSEIWPGLVGPLGVTARAPEAAGPSRQLTFVGELSYNQGLKVFCDAIDRLVAAGVALDITVSFVGADGLIDDTTGAAYAAERAARWPMPVHIEAAAGPRSCSRGCRPPAAWP